MFNTLDEFIDHVAEFVQEAFANQGEITPMWLAQTYEDEMIVIATPWRSSDEKDMVISTLQKLFREKNVKQYAFMAESWTLEAMNDQDIKEHLRGKSISDHKNRKEIVLITSEDKDSSRMGMFYIERPEGEKPKLSPLKKIPGEYMSGRMMGLLKENTLQ